MRVDFPINPKTFRICEDHWPAGTPVEKLPGGYDRPTVPPSIFPNVPDSQRPTHKPPPRPPKDPNKNLSIFNEKDKIKNFKTFKPETQLYEECQKRNQNIIISRSVDKLVCIFMSDDYSVCDGSIIVYNKKLLTSPLSIEAFRKGIRVTNLGSFLDPQNGLSKYSQFFEVVNRVRNFVPPFASVLGQIIPVLKVNIHVV